MNYYYEWIVNNEDTLHVALHILQDIEHMVTELYNQDWEFVPTTPLLLIYTDVVHVSVYKE